MTTPKTYFAVEFNPIAPTTNFNRAQEAAEREADRRQAPIAVYEDGKRMMIVHPAVKNVRHDLYN